MKHIWNMYQKSIKNQSKMTKNEQKIGQNWGLEGSRAGLKASWAVLGDPKDLWRHLGPSWRRLGREKWPTWLQLGSQNGAKMVQKSIKIWIIFWMPLGIDFCLIFDRFLLPKWRQVGTKIDQKSMSTSKGDFLKNRALPAAGARFFKIRGAKLWPSWDQNRSKIEVETSMQQRWW